MDGLKLEMLIQNDRSTSWPIFVVVEDKKIYGIDQDFADGKERKEIDLIDVDDLCESCLAKYDDNMEIPDDCDSCDAGTFSHYRIENDVPNLRAAFFFTGKACDEHIAANHHHYNATAHSYAISAYHNSELKGVIEFLKSNGSE